MTPHVQPFAGVVIDVKCPHCGELLPERGNKRRRIPRMGGRWRLVHAEPCARELDRQETLPVDGGRAA